MRFLALWIVIARCQGRGPRGSERSDGSGAGNGKGLQLSQESSDCGTYGSSCTVSRRGSCSCRAFPEDDLYELLLQSDASFHIRIMGRETL